MAEFDRSAFDRDEAAARKELKRYGLHKDAAFMSAFDGYMRQLSDNGRWISEGYTPKEEWAGVAAENLVAQFDRLQALHVPAKWWRDEYRNNGHHRLSTQALAAVAKETKKRKYLWSKSEPYYPAKKAAEAAWADPGDVAPGKIFNGKNFGFGSWSDAPVQARLWEHMSGHYVDGAEGPVTGVMLGGRVAGSVLTKYEWPHLKKLIEEGKVPHMHVKLMGFRGDSADSATWSLATKDSFDVRRQGSFDRIPSPDSDFADKQNRWRNREKERNAHGSSSSSPSSSDESASSNLSLANFHEVFNDPSAVVCMVDPYAGDGQISLSPEELSRASSASGVALENTQGLTGRALTEANVRNELAALAQGKQTLKEKIRSFREAQERGAGEAPTTFPLPAMPPPFNDFTPDQLTGGMHRMSVSGGSSGEFSPSTTRPPQFFYPESSASSEFMIDPGHYSGGAFVGDSSYPVPPEPVNTATYNPTYDDSRYAGRSATSSSSGGVPLGDRTPSPPETSVHGGSEHGDSVHSSSSDSAGGGIPLTQEYRQPAQEPSDSQSTRSRQGRDKGKAKAPKEVPALVRWAAGGRRR